MLAIGFRFPAGRYHATPWGRHVNEADVEWPPSPWRILRALVATWHRKADPQEIPEQAVERLLHKLSEDLPSYHLPRATRAHSRHYMPVRESREDRKVLIFDAFVRVDPTDTLVAAWPEVRLNVEEEALADTLLEYLGFLGRAESWVEAQRLPERSEKTNCRPGKLSIDTETGEAREPISLIAPRPPEEYSSWRAETVDSLGLTAKRLKKAQKALLATLPERFIDAVRLDTGEVQAAGWSQPPGARFVTYQRPYDCFTPLRRKAPRPRRPRPRPTTARLALTGRPLPRIEDAVQIGEVVRLAAIKQAEYAGTGIPPVLSGHDLPEESNHSHAFYLPEPNADGRIDHVLVHASGQGGLERDALNALDRIRRLWVQGGGEWQAILEHHGLPQDFPELPYLGVSSVWESVTPYLHPWFRKKRFGIEDQIRRECRERGLPEPKLQRLSAIRIKGRDRRPTHFRRFRSKRGLTQPDTQGSFWRLEFPESIPGPLALGFGCHYGLGMFRRTGVYENTGNVHVRSSSWAPKEYRGANSI